MIRVIGLNETVYEGILNHNYNIVKSYEDNMKMIEFIPECALNLEQGMITIQKVDNIVTFLVCDYWRIEIE